MLLTAGKPTAKGWKGDLVNFYTNSVRHIQNKPIKFLYCRWCQLVTGRSFLWHLRPVTTVVFGSTSSVTVTQNEQHGKYSDTLIVPFRVQIHTLPPPHCKEALVNFSDPFNCSGVPWREFLQCLANVLVWKKNSTYHSYYSYIVASVRYLI